MYNNSDAMEQEQNTGGLPKGLMSFRRRVFVLIFLLSLVAGCSLLPGDSITPTPVLTPTPAPRAEDAAQAFLKAWNAGDYNTMYAHLAPIRQATTPADQFISRYKTTLSDAGVKSVQATIISAREEGTEAEVKFSTVFETNLVGTVQQDNSMSLHFEDGRWGVLWTPSLILSQLTTGGSVKLYPQASARADILDVKGRPFTQPQQQIIVQVVPMEIKNESSVLAGLGRVFNMTPAAVKAKYSSFPRDWLTPIGTLMPDQVKANLEALNQPGIHIDTTRDIRNYPHGQAAAHVIGYVGQINADELEKNAVKGYREGDLIGKAGLEYWGESYLSGTRGGKLVVLSATGAVTATLASVPAKQSQNIYTTLDADAMDIADKALGDKTGAVVMLDVSNGGVLAMVSHPAYDPNKLSVRLSPAEFRTLLNDPKAPLLNRATQSAFPPGSVFKIVSYAAAVEKGVLAPTTLFTDPGYWDGLGANYRKYCWTWERTGKGHGTVTLSMALTTSCDVTFYQVGQKLDQFDRNLMTTFARGFGLGSETGIEISEVAGNVPDPKTQATWLLGDPINLVIGQGSMLTSPLQIADMLAAVANGGTLYRPRLVSRIGTAAQISDTVFQPQVRGKLPISAATLASIREALKKVTTDPKGTAYSAFKGAKIVSAGKTGTAEVFKEGDPHAWFAGYAPADNPKIALVVLVEHGGEGSVAAAPIFREIADKYLTLPKK